MKTLSDGGQQGYGVGKLRQEESRSRELKRICEPSLPQTNASKASQPPSDASQDAPAGFAAAHGSASGRKTEVLWTDGSIVGGVTVNNPKDLKAALCRAVDEGWRYIEAKTPNK